MQRRNFFQVAAAFVAGLFVGAPKATAAQRKKHPTERQADGLRINRVFRKDLDGTWKEIDRTKVKKGDRIVMLGLDDETGELWRAHILTAESDYMPCDPSDPEKYGLSGAVMEKDCERIIE